MSKRTFPVARCPFPVNEPVPANTRGKGILGRLKGVLHVKGEITDPAVPPNDWRPLD
ncbi:MAG: hypothetical protein ACE14L_12395 [Terriglobales bacterium]